MSVNLCVFRFKHHLNISLLLPPASSEGERAEAGGGGEAEESEGSQREGRARKAGATAEEEETAGGQRRYGRKVAHPPSHYAILHLKQT